MIYQFWRRYERSGLTTWPRQLWLWSGSAYGDASQTQQDGEGGERSMLNVCDNERCDV